MAKKTPTPCGAWPSPITTDLIVAKGTRLGSVRVDGDAVTWLELRPTEAGRSVLVRRDGSGETTDVTPAPWNVRTRVHEYGGGAYAVRDGVVVFAHFADQRLRRLAPGEAEPSLVCDVEGLRHADLELVPDGRLLAVEEDHRGEGEAIARIVAFAPPPGSDQPGAGWTRTVLVEGDDFYAAPRLSPDGRSLAFIAWSHPNMPWDGTELRVLALDEAGRPGATETIAGGPDGDAAPREPESVAEPRWSPGGVLHFVTDRSGWWTIHRRRAGTVEPVHLREAEFSGPHWIFGLTSFDFLDESRIVTRFTDAGRWRLGVIEADGSLRAIDTGFTELDDLRALPGGARIVARAASPTSAIRIVTIDLGTGAHEVLASSGDVDLDVAFIATGEAVEFPTTGGLAAHGILYRPTNRDACPLPDERPPLLVLSHGGPTGATTTALTFAIQFWTSRGFAVLDVNYGGSTGYGRDYRRRLDGQWGVVDVDDCCAGARHLVDRGEVDGERLAIRGGSAGGYTTLCALTFRDVFQVGASHYGVSDLEALCRDTHKFESRYGDRLVGPLPESTALYRERSPIHHTDRLAVPVILFQGLEDAVVPPSQAEVMVEALTKKGIPVAYVPFEGEQHGFRKAENIKRALEAELLFYGRVLGFEPADAIEPVEIANLGGGR